MEQVVIVPTGLEAFSVDPAFGSLVLPEQVEGDAVEHGKILRRMAGAFAVEVFAEADVEHPVQFVFDAPVLADSAVQSRRIGLEAGDVIADFMLTFARGLVIPLRLDAHQPL